MPYRGYHMRSLTKKPFKTDRGYVFVLCPDHPKAHDGYIKRSRFLIEQQIGRHLLTSEHVHHINGNKSDDRLENLQVMSKSDHMRHHADKGGGGKGKTQTACCPICGANFKACPTDLKRGKGKYCSLNCRSIARRKRSVLVCLQCGKFFEIVNCYIKDGRRFCSKKCTDDYKLAHHNKYEYKGRSKRALSNKHDREHMLSFPSGDNKQ
jgi:hypothetical protein